ncbi:hypothetical protein J6590_065382 [Homalodisca vitripennis]|nr:hypothetical protein J6590_065382 [Homalodisca vitripennis]
MLDSAPFHVPLRDKKVDDKEAENFLEIFLMDMNSIFVLNQLFTPRCSTSFGIVSEISLQSGVSDVEIFLSLQMNMTPDSRSQNTLLTTDTILVDKNEPESTGEDILLQPSVSELSTGQFGSVVEYMR